MTAVSLVVPSCREPQIVEFVSAWHEQVNASGAAVYVVEDGPERTFAMPPWVKHLCWADSPTGMLDCISVPSPACRQIGVFHAYRDGADVIITLDDDVRPVSGDDAIQVFRSVVTEGIPVWVDPLLNYRSRGHPEHNVGTLQVSFHVGSFVTIPDVDADTQLRFGGEFTERPPQYVPRPTIVPPRQLIPVNGGACAWHRALTPYVHYTVWDETLEYRRFEDIWMGVILKRLLDHCGLAMSYGPPRLKHVRASDAVRNARLEAEGKRFNEVFWQQLDEALAGRLDPDDRDPAAAWRAIAGALQALGNPWARREGEAMLRWSDFF